MTTAGDGHLSSARLLACLDGTLEEVEATAARSHLSACERCSRALESLREFESIARSIPAERASPDLVRNVMVRIGIAPRASFFVRAVSALPYALAMLIVGGVLLAVFTWSGAISPSAWSSVPGTAADAYAAFGSAVNGVTASLAGMFTKFVPQMSMSGLRLGIGLVMVLVAVAALDRLLFWRTAQRPQ